MGFSAAKVLTQVKKNFWLREAWRKFDIRQLGFDGGTRPLPGPRARRDPLSTANPIPTKSAVLGSGTTASAAFASISSGCASWVALNQPGSTDDELVKLGMPRAEVESVLRTGGSAYDEPNGHTRVRYQYSDGVHQESKARILLYLARDFFTLFLSGLIFWPLELAVEQAASTSCFWSCSDGTPALASEVNANSQALASAVNAADCATAADMVCNPSSVSSPAAPACDTAASYIQGFTDGANGVDITSDNAAVCTQQAAHGMQGQVPAPRLTPASLPASARRQPLVFPRYIFVYQRV